MATRSVEFTNFNDIQCTITLDCVFLEPAHDTDEVALFSVSFVDAIPEVVDVRDGRGLRTGERRYTRFEIFIQHD